MHDIPGIVAFSVYRVLRVPDPSSSTKENVSHPIFWQYNSFPATGVLGTYMTAVIQREETLPATRTVTVCSTPRCCLFQMWLPCECVPFGNR